MILFIAVLFIVTETKTKNKKYLEGLNNGRWVFQSMVYLLNQAINNDNQKDNSNTANA